MSDQSYSLPCVGSRKEHALIAVVPGLHACKDCGWFESVDLDVSRLPAPIAAPLLGLIRTPSAMHKFFYAFDVAESVMRLAVALVVAQRSSELEDSTATKLFALRSLPSLGSWWQAATKLVKAEMDDECQRHLPFIVTLVERLRVWISPRDEELDTLWEPAIPDGAEAAVGLRNVLAHRPHLWDLKVEWLEAHVRMMLWALRPRVGEAHRDWAYGIHLLVRASDASGRRFELRGSSRGRRANLIRGADNSFDVLLENDKNQEPERLPVIAVVDQTAFDVSPWYSVDARTLELGHFRRRRDNGVFHESLSGASIRVQGSGYYDRLTRFRDALHIDLAETSGVSTGHFDQSFKRDAESYVWREAKERQLAECLKDARSKEAGKGRPPRRILWVQGDTGSGKSMLAAYFGFRMMSQGADSAPTEEAARAPVDFPAAGTVVNWQFRQGDQRCAIQPFLRWTLQRLTTREEHKGRIRGVSDEDLVGVTTAAIEQHLREVNNSPIPLIFVLDGIDEIAQQTCRIMEVIPKLAESGAVVVAFGRPSIERLPPDAPEEWRESHEVELLGSRMRAAGAEVVFPDGLGHMTSEEVSAWLSRELSTRSIEAAGEDWLGWINEVWQASEGWPLYITRLIELIRSDEVAVGGGALPDRSSLFSSITQSFRLDNASYLRNPVLATVGLAVRDPTAQMIENALAAAHEGFEVGVGSEPVERSLVALSSILSLTSSEDSIRYRPMHEKLREHIRTAPELSIPRAVARRGWAKLCVEPHRWATGSSLRDALGIGVLQLRQLGFHAEAEILLSDPSYVWARIAAGDHSAEDDTDVVSDLTRDFGGSAGAPSTTALIWRATQHLVLRGNSLAFLYEGSSRMRPDRVRWACRALLRGRDESWIYRLGRSEQAHARSDDVQELPNAGASSLAISADGRVVFGSCWNGDVFAWWPSVQRLFVATDAVGLLMSAAVSDDGRWGILGGTSLRKRDRSVYLVALAEEPSTPRVERLDSGPSGASNVLQVWMDPAGEVAGALRADGTGTLWSVQGDRSPVRLEIAEGTSLVAVVPVGEATKPGNQELIAAVNRAERRELHRLHLGIDRSIVDRTVIPVTFEVTSVVSAPAAAIVGTRDGTVHEVENGRVRCLEEPGIGGRVVNIQRDPEGTLRSVRERGRDRYVELAGRAAARRGFASSWSALAKERPFMAVAGRGRRDQRDLRRVDLASSSGGDLRLDQRSEARYLAFVEQRFVLVHEGGQVVFRSVAFPLHETVDGAGRATAEGVVAGSISPSGDVLATAHEDGHIRLLDLGSGSIRVVGSHVGKATCVEWHSAAVLYSGWADGVILRHQIDRPEEPAMECVNLQNGIAVLALRRTTGCLVLLDSKGGIWEATQSLGGDRILYGHNLVHVNAKPGLPDTRGGVLHVSGDGHLLVVSTTGGELVIVRAASSGLQRVSTGDAVALDRALSISPTSDYLVAAGERTLRVFAVGTRDPEPILRWDLDRTVQAITWFDARSFAVVDSGGVLSTYRIVPAGSAVLPSSPVTNRA